MVLDGVVSFRVSKVLIESDVGYGDSPQRDEGETESVLRNSVVNRSWSGSPPGPTLPHAGLSADRCQAVIKMLE
jgi:hypothetical protein